MKEILELIDTKKEKLSQLPFFRFLQEKSIHPHQRLAWAPCYAPLAMSFTDLLKYDFRREPAIDKVQELLNNHTYDEATHYIWYLQDIEKLGFNQPQKFTDFLKFIWSEDTSKTRQIYREITKLTDKADSVVLLAMMEMIEAATYVFFSNTKKVAEELQGITHEKYNFFGDHHIDAETAHDLWNTGTEDFIKSIQLTKLQQEEARYAVEKIFDMVVEFVDGLMRYAEKYPVQKQLVSV